ncbi:tetratricopeptide repeat protein [Allokutzneria sp. NRRL B-24872]|uniref:tetratricopeptide repeat protein n=1 Tax=Allokutzneria sp. NRRL B-24872 TaxID=1137961 RepID=UPI0011786A81|nr:tetratricopeptide repeat protein [Allokutzneria sp. NRRL B-24872]
MRQDQHGVPLTAASSAAVEELDRAVDSLLHFRSDVGDLAARVVAEDPVLPLGNAMRVHLAVLSTDPAHVPVVADEFAKFLSVVDLAELTEGERMHLTAASHLLDGDLVSAARVLTGICTAQPRDAMALAFGHQIDFLMGDAVSLRDRIGGAMHAWGESDPHFANLLGMYAFGLEECGHWDQAEQAGLRAMSLDPADVWSIHAVGHAHEMRARFSSGIELFDRRRPDWDSDNLLRVHIWWHYCLFLLESGQPERALEIYDTKLAPSEADTIRDAVNAASLLWRLHLDGVHHESRWQELARTWPPRMKIPFSAFNDMHAVMSYVGAGDDLAAEQLIAERKRYLVDAPENVSNAAMTARVGLPVCEALLAFGRGRYDEAVDHLWPVRRRVHEFGGSHAQRDVVQRTLVEAAVRAGRTDQAHVLVSERISLRPDSPYNHLKLTQLRTA